MTDKRKFVVELDRPRGATLAELEAYIADAVATWHGSLEPTNPIFALDGDSVRVRRISRKRR